MDKLTISNMELYYGDFKALKGINLNIQANEITAFIGPSGNRRFIGVELTGPIDVSVRPNYQQLFAQALTALHNVEKSYVDAEQVKLIMKNNCQFEVAEPIDQYFQLYFDLVEKMLWKVPI